MTTIREKKNTQKKVKFLTIDELELRDTFAATWWQSRERFLSRNLSIIGKHPEQASFLFMEEGRVSMTRDWLDLSVEHLSKWWKILHVYKQKSPIPFYNIMYSLMSYIQKDVAANLRISPAQNLSEAITQHTIVVMPFMAYGTKVGAKEKKSFLRERHDDNWGDKLTAVSLSATLSSLIRNGFGRVVVASFNARDILHVHSAIRLLSDKDGTCWIPSLSTFKWNETINCVLSKNQENGVVDDILTAPQYEIGRIGGTEIGFISMIRPKPDSGHAKNVPRATLIGLKAALEGKSNENELWLGRNNHASFWKYVYLTEPDTILQTRTNIFSEFQNQLDQQAILVPHRLQPIPHESDLYGYDGDRGLYVPAHGPMKHVESLDANVGDVCCDDGIDKPWYKYGKCENGFWYICGFNNNNNEDNLTATLQRHYRLLEYPLMRLKQGVGLTSLAGTEHGRRCIPQKAGSEC